MFMVISTSNPRIVYSKLGARMRDVESVDKSKITFTDYWKAVATCRRMSDAGKKVKLVRKEDYEISNA